MIEETIEWEDMVQAHKWNALHNAASDMVKLGGGFASALASAWRKADKSNKRKIENEFSDLFFEYMDAGDRAWFGSSIH
jgi:hypothetical protein